MCQITLTRTRGAYCYGAMGTAVLPGDACPMTSGSPLVSNAIARVAAVAVMTAALTTLAVAPAAAKPAKARPGKASASVQDVSGLQVTRTWKIAADDPGTLVATVHVQNTNTAPVTTTILEPMPTDSLKKVKFTP